MNPRDVPVRHSNLKCMGQSPAHYLHRINTPSEPSSAMALGTAIHAAVLDGKPPLVYGGAARRGKDWEAFRGDNPDATVVTVAEAHTIAMVAKAVLADRNAARVLEGEREKTILWNHGDRACQSTPDVVNKGRGFITDLKTCKTANPRDFMWQAKKLAYHSQLAFYDAAIGGVGDHYIVAAETSPPYPVVVYRLARSTIELGRALWMSWFERLRVCEDAGDWPGYSRLIEDLEFPQDAELDWEVE